MKYPQFHGFIFLLLATLSAPPVTRADEALPAPEDHIYAGSARSPVSVTVDTRSPGCTIPEDFSGVSIFTGTQRLGHRGISGNLFSGTNFQLITLFTNTGIHHLRLGATGSPDSDETNLSHADIDSLFAFAQATGIKVIYSLHARDAAATARYIWDHYRPWLDCFAFDNEPDGRMGGSGAAADSYYRYLVGWRGVAREVTNAVLGATFAGPDAAGRSLVPRFAADQKNSRTLVLITQHIYVGGNPRKKGVDAAHAIDNMLSHGWLATNYPGLYAGTLLPAVQAGFPFRLTESDDCTHGVTNASDTFAAALWALDYMHWWAARGAVGVNFQNTEWLRTDTFHPDDAGNYQIYPKAYGLRAFDLGGHGRVESVTIENPGDLNLTAYAVGDATNLWITIINKEHGPSAHDALVAIGVEGFSAGNGEFMRLLAPHGDIAATTGVTLGGAGISNDAPWAGRWTPLNSPVGGRWTIFVPAASAAILKL